MRPNNTMTIRALLDAIDYNRDGEGCINVIDSNGCVECRAMTKSAVWDGIQDRLVNCIGVSENEICIWLEDE